MQIVIDTQKDSKEDIRKAAAFLSSLSDGVKEHHSNIFEDSSPSLETPSSEPTNAFANMFSGSESKDVVDGTPILGVTEQEEEKEEISPSESETKEDEEVPSTMIEY